MNIISIDGLSKRTEDGFLLRNVSIGIDSNEKTGFIGSNGTGKSTFLRIISGLETCEEGQVSVKKDLNISFLEQNPKVPEGITLKKFLFLDGSPRIKLIKEYQAFLETYDHSPSGEKVLADLTEQMDNAGAWEIENKYSSLIKELDLPDPDSIMVKFSGGMIKKAALARALSLNPDLLLLDEPTNHLDIRTIEWLEKYLSGGTFAFVMVTHDRYFLDRICTYIMEIDRKRIYKYKGNYSTFLERKQERIQEERNRQSRIDTILKRELEWLKRGPKARAGKDKKRKMRIQDLLDKRTEEEHENADFSSSARRMGKKILDLKDISISFDGKTVIKPFSYSFKRGQRVGIIGPNGSGKTTFLDIAAGRLLPDSGTVDKGENTVIGYYDQLSTPLLEETAVLGFIEKKAERIITAEGQNISASKFLEMFGFGVSMQRNMLSTLSGGERRRLYLISVLAGNPNFLILDEPVNDLDVETMTKLEEYIDGFDGTILTVSHDRAFLDRTCDYLLIFDGDGRIQSFTGNYSDYQILSENKRKTSPLKKTEKPQRERNNKTLSFKEKRELEALMEDIEKLEEEKRRLEIFFTAPGISPLEAAKNGRIYEQICKDIEEKSLRWEKLAELA